MVKGRRAKYSMLRLFLALVISLALSSVNLGNSTLSNQAAAQSQSTAEPTGSIPNIDPGILQQAEKFLSPSILPPHENAIGGGNPLEGLGRSDDPGPSRRDKFDEFGNPLTLPAAGDPASGITTGVGLAGEAGITPAEEKEETAGKEKAEEEKDFFAKRHPGQTNATLRPAGISVPDPAAKLALDELKSGKYEQALKHLENLGRLYPKAYELDYLAAIACVMQHRFDEAEKYYRKVLGGTASPELKDLARRGLLKLGKSL